MRESEGRGGSAAEAGGEAPLLASRRFLPLFLVQALGAFNDNVFKNAFVSLLTFRLAAELEMSIGVLTTLAAGIFILPFALFAPFAGQIADRIDKARMMRAVKFAEIVLMIGAAIAYHLQSVPLLYFLLFLMGAQSAFFSPIKYGVLPQYLKSSELVRGNGFIQAATFFAILIGTIVGLNLILTDAGVFWVSAAVIAIAIIGFVASLYAPPAPPIDGDFAILPNYGLRVIGDGGLEPTLRRAAPGAAISAAVLALIWGVGAGGLELEISLGALALIWATHLVWPSIADSVAAAQAEPTAWRAILAIGWFWFVGATFMALMPAFAKEQLGGDNTVFTLLLAGFSIGVAIGSVLCGMLYRGAIRVGPAPWGAIGIAVFSTDLAFAVPPNQPPSGEYLMNAADFLSAFQGWRVFLDFVGLAICAGLYVTPLNAVYQSAAPHDARGRVVACSNMIDSTLMAISAGAILGFLAAGLAPQHIFAIVGGTGLVAALVVARWAPETRIGRVARSLLPLRSDP